MKAQGGRGRQTLGQQRVLPVQHARRQADHIGREDGSGMKGDERKVLVCLVRTEAAGLLLWRGRRCPLSKPPAPPCGAWEGRGIVIQTDRRSVSISQHNTLAHAGRAQGLGREKASRPAGAAAGGAAGGMRHTGSAGCSAQSAAAGAAVLRFPERRKLPVGRGRQPRPADVS